MKCGPSFLTKRDRIFDLDGGKVVLLKYGMMCICGQFFSSDHLDITKAKKEIDRDIWRHSRKCESYKFLRHCEIHGYSSDKILKVLGD